MSSSVLGVETLGRACHVDDYNLLEAQQAGAKSGGGEQSVRTFEFFLQTKL